MEKYKEQYKKKREEIEIELYVLNCMLVTLDTTHFEMSLLNTDAVLNAVQIIQLQ